MKRKLIELNVFRVYTFKLWCLNVLVLREGMELTRLLLLLCVSEITGYLFSLCWKSKREAKLWPFSFELGRIHFWTCFGGIALEHRAQDGTIND